MRSAVIIIAAVALGILMAATLGHQEAFSSSKSRDVVQTVADGQVIAKAGMDHLLRLRTQGRLPGITTNDHGNASISGRLSDYPFALTMQFRPTGSVSTENYSIIQLKRDSPWQLRRAWQADSNGQIIHEWPVQ
jgi:hypothetical protein